MSDRAIYVGVWTNWDQGPVLGLTLTVPAIWGLVFVAVLALVVKWAGSHVWGIICFIVHDFLSTQKDHDGLHYQRQALLRSKTSESDFLLRIWELSWAWKAHTPSTFRRNIFLALVALINMVAFLVAGIFSARVTVTDSEGLLVGTCGWLEKDADKDFPQWTKNDWETGDALFVTAYNGYRQILTYSQTCYAGNMLNTSEAQCDFPATPYIESSIDRDADCPFADEACTGRAISLDSGLINSDTHLGINSAPGGRVQVRKVTSCAPIDMDAYTTGWTPTPAPGTEMFFPTLFPNDTFKYYSMGSSWLFGAPISNFTFVMSNYSLYVNGLPYTFDVRTSYTKNFIESGFMPDPQFNRTDADVSILTLNNRVAYTGRVDDPFFEATLPAGGNRLAEAWVSKKILTGLACTEQYQFCNPALSGEEEEACTSLSGMYEFDTLAAPAHLSLNARQQATYRLMRNLIYVMRFNSFLMFLKNEILVANKLVYGSFGISTALPNATWQTEVENIHNLSLAGYQMNTIQHAANQDAQIRPGLNLLDHIVPETDPEAQKLCRNQRVHTAVFSSFSMLGIIIIVVVSLLIILVDMNLPSLVHRVRRRRRRHHHRHQRRNSSSSLTGERETETEKGDLARQAWEEDDILQIQRLAFEGHGIAPWHRNLGGVPVTQGWDVRFSRERLFGTDSSSSSSSFISSGRTTSNNNNKVGLAGACAGTEKPSYDVFEPLMPPTMPTAAAPQKAGAVVRESVFEFDQTPQSSVFRLPG